MSQSILQSFLNEHIIDIDQNEDFSNLTKSASELEKRLRNKKVRIIQASLVAFDPHVDPSEPLLQEVQEIVVSKWKAFPSKCKDKPVPYLRAVILSALQGLQNELTLSGIVWLTVSNFLPYFEYTDREAKLLNSFLKEFGNQFEQAGWKLWNVNEKPELPPFPEVKSELIEKVNPIKTDYAKDNLVAALGISGDGKNSENFYSFQTDYYNNQVTIKPSEKWAESFSSIAGTAIEAIARHIINSLNKVVEQVVSIEYIENYSNQLVKYLSQVSNSIKDQGKAQNLRSQLLWVKESKYSVSQGKSYREIPVAVLPIVVALDLKEVVPSVYPISIDYFLKEIIINIDFNSHDQITFESIMKEFLSSATTLSSFESLGAQQEPGRLTLLVFVKELIAGRAVINDFEIRTGIKITDKISRANLGDWFFREFQAEKVITAK